MDGRVANEFQRLCRKIYEEFGLDYTVMNVCSARFARGLHVITFNREDADERARADACYRKMSEEVGARGVFVGQRRSTITDFTCGRPCRHSATPARASRTRSIQTGSLRPAVTALLRRRSVAPDQPNAHLARCVAPAPVLKGSCKGEAGGGNPARPFVRYFIGQSFAYESP